MNQINTARRSSIVRALIEGNSIRATCRITGTAKNTVTKLLVELGEACSLYQDIVLRNLPAKVVQCDEIWSFVGAKEANIPLDQKGQGKGDVWTWTALDADSKLMISWLVGDRGPETAREFMQSVANRLANRVQLTTDGYSPYLRAVDDAFGIDVDYAMIQKVYGTETGKVGKAQRRYSPPLVLGVEKRRIEGDPAIELVSTSFVERTNLSMRMQMRRFTRLTNGFSKKVENHAHAVSLHFMAYNFVTPHGTLTKARKIKTTPAMAAGLAKRPWTLEEVLALLDTKKSLQSI